MATCEFHDKYLMYLAETAIRPLVDRSVKFWGWDAVLGVINIIKTSEFLEQITPEEANGLNSELLNLYPQFEENIRKELEKNITSV